MFDRLQLLYVHKRHGKWSGNFPNGGKFVGKFKLDKPWKGKEFDKDGNDIASFVNGEEKND